MVMQRDRVLGLRVPECTFQLHNIPRRVPRMRGDPWSLQRRIHRLYQMEGNCYFNQSHFQYLIQISLTYYQIIINKQPILLSTIILQQQQIMNSIPQLQKMEQPSTISDASIIILIWKVVENMRRRGDGDTLDCLLNEEKLLHLTLMTLQKKSLKAPPFDLTEEIVLFIQKINKLTMETFEKDGDDSSSNLFIKAIDLLMTKSLGKYITPLRILGELKVLTFNNLGCIYKRKKKLTLALRSVSFALEIEEALVQNQAMGDKHNIVTTYLNKAAILSEMNKHQKAIDEINKGMKYLISLEKQNNEKQEVITVEEKKTVEERRHYCTYMKMIVFYNLGVENEHLNMKESAELCYRRGKVIADNIGNEVMKKKLQEILVKLSA